MKHNLVIKVLLVTILVLLAVNLIRPLLSPSLIHAARRLQYKAVEVERYGDAQVVESSLNKYAKDGWEFVGTTYFNVLIFKK